MGSEVGLWFSSEVPNMGAVSAERTELNSPRSSGWHWHPAMAMGTVGKCFALTPASLYCL